jgi:GNAT superfamily N-acetyltransferase
MRHWNTPHKTFLHHWKSLAMTRVWRRTGGCYLRQFWSPRLVFHSSSLRLLLERSVRYNFNRLHSPTSIKLIHFLFLQIAGLRVITIKKKDEPKEPPFPFKFQKNKEIFDYVIGLSELCGTWERYPSISQFPELFGISVDPEFRKQGLAKEIYRRALAFLKAKGFSVARCGFTSPFSRKAAKSLGCKIVVGEKCSEAKTPGGRLLNPNAKPDDIADYGFFEL